MITINVSLSEVKKYFKEIRKKPGEILKMIRIDLPRNIGNYLNKIMESVNNGSYYFIM